WRYPIEPNKRCFQSCRPALVSTCDLAYDLPTNLLHCSRPDSTKGKSKVKSQKAKVKSVAGAPRVAAGGFFGDWSGGIGCGGAIFSSSAGFGTGRRGVFASSVTQGQTEPIQRLEKRSICPHYAD